MARRRNDARHWLAVLQDRDGVAATAAPLQREPRLCLDSGAGRRVRGPDDDQQDVDVRIDAKLCTSVAQAPKTRYMTAIFELHLPSVLDCLGDGSVPEVAGEAMTTPVLRIVPTDLKTANAFVRRLHRHSRPVVGHRFSIGVADENGILRGVAIVGRPVAQRLDNGTAAEITRVCTDGTRNACSMLYGAARRAARAMGMQPIYTYTLPEEGGSSLRAAGFRLDKADAGGSAAMWHNRPGRNAQPIGDDLVGGKWRWVG